jgi:mRNA-degrading endonuclease RelE of RelBE toxin-antitoxin system
VTYEVEITPEGLRHLSRLPDKVRAAVLETIFGSIAENPQRTGRPLRGELEGLYSARRGEFRVIYEIDEAAGVVLVHPAKYWRAPIRGVKRPSGLRDGSLRPSPAAQSTSRLPPPRNHPARFG